MPGDQVAGKLGSLQLEPGGCQKRSNGNGVFDIKNRNRNGNLFKNNPFVDNNGQRFSHRSGDSDRQNVYINPMHVSNGLVPNSSQIKYNNEVLSHGNFNNQPLPHVYNNQPHYNGNTLHYNGNDKAHGGPSSSYGVPSQQNYIPKDSQQQLHPKRRQYSNEKQVDYQNRGLGNSPQSMPGHSHQPVPPHQADMSVPPPPVNFPVHATQNHNNGTINNVNDLMLPRRDQQQSVTKTDQRKVTVKKDRFVLVNDLQKHVVVNNVHHHYVVNNMQEVKERPVVQKQNDFVNAPPLSSNQGAVSDPIEVEPIPNSNDSPYIEAIPATESDPHVSIESGQMSISDYQTSPLDTPEPLRQGIVLQPSEFAQHLSNQLQQLPCHFQRLPNHLQNLPTHLQQLSNHQFTYPHESVRQLIPIPQPALLSQSTMQPLSSVNQPLHIHQSNLVNSSVTSALANTSVPAIASVNTSVNSSVLVHQPLSANSSVTGYLPPSGRSSFQHIPHVNLPQPMIVPQPLMYQPVQNNVNLMEYKNFNEPIDAAQSLPFLPYVPQHVVMQPDGQAIVQPQNYVQNGTVYYQQPQVNLPIQPMLHPIYGLDMPICSNGPAPNELTDKELPENFKTIDCEAILTEGRCHYGEKCFFFHEGEDPYKRVNGAPSIEQFMADKEEHIRLNGMADLENQEDNT
ncbi:unnamed protein product [Bursaphelenchus okinawaensis]|uniref:C3H1-type domain-containing protein n=1 Tax=Bursaphelenchus okinawaensis TaxID=465554 RepID=A0A811LAR2_9BILA|nr:unnamed protein product [Bursaphelenchus okinawaensis]CAG9122179.1 unnamed protein product [Bursaphelenchus okinawaensis]